MSPYIYSHSFLILLLLLLFLYSYYSNFYFLAQDASNLERKYTWLERPQGLERGCASCHWLAGVPAAGGLGGDELGVSSSATILSRSLQ